MFFFAKIFLFDDAKDHGKLIGVNNSKINVIDTKHLTWTRNEFNSSSTDVELTVSGGNPATIGDDGIINFKVCREKLKISIEKYR